MTASEERPIEVVKTTEPAVRAFFERVWGWLIQGWTAARIARALQAEGQSMPVQGPKGRTRWVPPTESGITRIRRNPLYAGLLVIWRRRTKRTPHGKKIQYTRATEQEIVAGRIERYVSPEDYWRVQAQAAGRKFPTYISLGEGDALCNGLIYCGRCGGRLSVVYVYRKQPTPHRKSHYYRCQGPWSGRHANKNCAVVSGRLLDSLVSDLVLEKLWCPAPAALRQAIDAENARRQEAHRLLATID